MYDCLIIGGGIAGMQAAVQLARYRRKVAVLDRGDGRSTLCRSYKNILGWPDGISGQELRAVGRAQAECLGAEWQEADIVRGERADAGAFRLFAADGRLWEGRSVLVATGVMDRFPPLPGLERCLGRSVFVCPDCDGYEVANRETVVLGSGNAGAGMAETLAYFTDRLLYVNHEDKPIDARLSGAIADRGIRVVPGRIAEVIAEGDGWFRGVRLEDGREVNGERGFIAFGGNDVRSALAECLGAELAANRHIVTDPRTKRTTADGVWAAGDVGVHSEQVAIAMGEGAQAAIWIHKTLLKEEKAEAGTRERAPVG